jgi:glycosyltransferase involved in cell wall biosynthesis
MKSFTLQLFRILHGCWQTLPRPWRQQIFHYFVSVGLPSPAPVPAEQALEPVVVAGALTAATGVGQAARLAVHALRAAGVEVRTFDLTKALLQSPTESFDLGLPLESGTGTLLLYVTPPNVPLALRVIGRRRLASKYRIGAWVCETQRLPALWRRQARFLHAVAAPSTFSQTAIAAGIGRTVHLLGHPVEAEPWPEKRSIRRPQPTVGAILDVGSSAARKNVRGLTAFCAQLIDEEPELKILLKARDLSADPVAAAELGRVVAAAQGRVELHSDDWSRNAVVRFLDELDLLVSFSRAEGFGLPIAEAMRRGTAVAAPIWGGPADYLDGGTAIALPFNLIDIADPSRLYERSQGQWADVDVAASARLVGAAVRDRVALDIVIRESLRRSGALFSADQFVAQLRATRQE